MYSLMPLLTPIILIPLVDRGKSDHFLSLKNYPSTFCHLLAPARFYALSIIFGKQINS